MNLLDWLVTKIRLIPDNFGAIHKADWICSQLHIPRLLRLKDLPVGSNELCKNLGNGLDHPKLLKNFHAFSYECFYARCKIFFPRSGICVYTIISDLLDFFTEKLITEYNKLMRIEFNNHECPFLQLFWLV